ncbi:putative solute carrier family 15 member 4-like [Apostichopus japonicus]|uniref:Putative solute carrier family 15 member 4-like n=1 Tax=Stichopus japonicus TaxID=307972 RepID=A0A2G8KP65_STIJA|nr:putative solute carrier family 15 member 4-like [Apostichopus japonicus]
MSSYDLYQSVSATSKRGPREVETWDNTGVPESQVGPLGQLQDPLNFIEKTLNLRIILLGRLWNMDSESDRSEHTPLVGRKNVDRRHHASTSSGVVTAVEDVSFWKSGRASVVLCILFTELCERLTFYSISANLVLFCTSVLKVESATALTISLAFTGTSFFLPLFGGYIADTIAGRFNTIYGSALLYLVGTALLPAISYEYKQDLEEPAKRAYFAIALFLVAIGTGGIKANVGPFGAQQLEEFGEGAIRSFFNWFYWFINVGSGISFSLVVYIQQNYNFFYGFLIPTVTILLANLLFLLKRREYINHPPEGSALTNIVKITATSTCGRCCCCRCCLGRRERRNSDPVESPNIQSQFDYAKESNGGKYLDSEVESTKSILRLLPIFGTFILYWTVYNQMSSTYFLQGERLRLKYNDFTLPAAILNLFDVIAILILVPFFDRILYPGLQKLGVNFTLLRRIGTGMFLATCSVIIAAVVEIERKRIMEEGHYIAQNLSTETFNASDLSVFVQIPQFAFIGASEVFASVTGLEFAYSQAPVALQGVIMGLFLLTTGLGSYFGSLLVLIVNSISGMYGTQWLPDDPNEGRLEYFFFLLAVLMGINIIIYLVVANSYEYVKPTTYIEFDADDAANYSGEQGHSGRRKQPPRADGGTSESEI